MYYCADLQSVHTLCCYDNIAPNAKCQRVLVLAPCLVDVAVGKGTGAAKFSNWDYRLL